MNLLETLSIYGGGPGSGCQGPNCGRPIGTGKESKAQAIERIMKERGLRPESGLSKGIAERVYHEQRFGDLKTLQKLAKSSQTAWQTTAAFQSQIGTSVRYVKDLGRGKGQLEVLVSQSHKWQPEGGGARPTIDVTVRHKMNPKAQTSTTPEHRTFVWETGMKQAKEYLQKQYGIQDFSSLKDLG